MNVKLVVLGGGESGTGAAVLGKKENFEVFLSDFGQIEKKYKQVLLHHEIEWEENGHSDARILQAELVVKSPGIPDTAPIVRQLNEAGIPVISEVEFASRFTDAQLVAITGSNGKTTTATLTNYLLDKGGLDVSLAGNIGDSFALDVANRTVKNYVLEVSSFQLDGIADFKPHIAVLTNITPDHLDRYDYQLENYVASKFRIAMNQSADDYFIYDADDPIIRKGMEVHPVRARLIPFSLERILEEGAYVKDENIIVNINNTQFIMPVATLNLQGKHNIKNAMAASTVATLVQIRKETIRACLENFQAVEHRLEKVLKINQVNYINDSKATNVNATFYALESMTSPTVWIVGGVDKGNDYSELLPLVNEKVKAIICLGLENDKIISAFGNVVDLMIEAHSMSDAVQVAYRLAKKGDTVLLSPACASFDLFENYEDRGKQFKEAVRNL
ncbi:UDP-N-acetylmuramoyl-L-alanine--D-glutamate ligase [Aureitalea marina]|uniref:UDP-N-acetylmuramoylalanine--D-glutamate ligase n=1 Tax=Aureitalea marina TaxID=930804 RepID=A0A2S7KM53_9FLAO|nr:UDP-N-acetylmuramoyl-L-alanine--D-glutamate ligase [Aureitalea marina]PQB03682.1 UDP-N-acetylmuramoylalanine--D-glutamate ligase [Aureitalea marina]